MVDGGGDGVKPGVVDKAAGAVSSGRGMSATRGKVVPRRQVNCPACSKPQTFCAYIKLPFIFEGLVFIRLI